MKIRKYVNFYSSSGETNKTRKQQTNRHPYVHCTRATCTYNIEDRHTQILVQDHHEVFLDSSCCPSSVQLLSGQTPPYVRGERVNFTPDTVRFFFCIQNSAVIWYINTRACWCRIYGLTDCCSISGRRGGEQERVCVCVLYTRESLIYLDLVKHTKNPNTTF